MKKIEATIEPWELTDVKERLSAIRVDGMTVTEIKGFGRRAPSTEAYRGARYVVDFAAEMKVEIVVPDDDVTDVLEAIEGVAKKSLVAEGRVAVLPVDDVIRIRTGERGHDVFGQSVPRPRRRDLRRAMRVVR